MGYYYNQDAVTFPESVCVSAEQAMCYMFDSTANAFEGYCWNKLYCKSMINNYCLRLDLQLIEAEDTSFNFLYLKNSEHVSLISYAGISLYSTHKFSFKYTKPELSFVFN